MKAGSTTQIAGGEVLAAVVHEGVAAVAGAVADLAGDADLERPASWRGRRACRARASSRSSSQPRIAAIWRWPSAVEVGAGVVDLLGGVEQRAVVDPDGVGVLVLDDGAVHERAEVLAAPCRAGRWW